MPKLPVIETERLYLRQIEKKDARAIYEYAKDPRVGPNAGWSPHQSLRDTRTFIHYSLTKMDHGQPGVYVVFLKAEEKLVGTVEVHTVVHEFSGALGMVLHPDYWGQGIMLEASEALIIYAFEYLQLRRLVYAHYLDNTQSRRLREKLQFQFEGIARNGALDYRARPIDEAISSLTDKDYANYKPYYDHLKKSIKIFK